MKHGDDTSFLRHFGGWFLTTILFWVPVRAELTLTPLLSTPQPEVKAGAEAIVLLTFLNPERIPLRIHFPAQLELQLQNGSANPEIIAKPTEESLARSIQPQGFSSLAYRFNVPAELNGEVTLTVARVNGSAIRYRVAVPASSDPPFAPTPSPANGTLPGERPAPSSASAGNLGRHLEKEPDHLGQNRAEEFFRNHFFPYEPMYAITGGDHPNTKIQLSFKYRLVGDESSLANTLPALRGLYFAYTQVSLWDTSALSAPFLDTSYKPELHYEWRDIRGRDHFPDWMRFDFETGLQHESNGKAGDDSRTINLFYVRPTVVFGPTDGWHFSLGPKVWTYLGSRSDNPDIAEYRGYVELLARFGKDDSAWVGATVRAGDALTHGSISLDVSYPIHRLTADWFVGYLYLQYFNGYGESLLNYHDRSSTVRFGYALFR